MRTIQDLQQLQGLPLNLKIRMTKERIRQWINEYGEDGVYVSFSGGKDSTVLLHLVREDYPNVKAVFVDTGLEYPEIRQFVKTYDNVEWLKPKMGFKQVIQKYGYPFISKEVSECVYGARKYLTHVIEESSLDRPTDRPTDRPPYSYRFDRLCGLNEFAKSKSGWADSKVSIRDGEADRNRQIWEAIKHAANDGIGGGGSVRDFANLTGTRGREPRTIVPSQWKYYDQFVRTRKTDCGTGSVFTERKDGKADRSVHSGLGQDEKGEYP